MEEVQDEPLFCERAAGIDVGKKMVVVTVRVPGSGPGGRRRQETREFGTTRRQLLALAAWLRSWGVERAGMEATSDYWKPLYFLLEREGLDCELYHAAQVKALPGRPKTDRLDSVWLAKVTERGLAAASFVPPEDIRRLRACTRYRRSLVRARTAEKQRCEKLLEDACVKLSSVIADIHGASGRDMLNAVIAGERSPAVLAQLARKRMRGKIPQLEEALDCAFFTGEHAFILKMMLEAIDRIDGQVAALDERIAVLCEPWERQVAQLDGIPGFGPVAARELIAEIGIDMGVFPTAGHLCSWARVAPQVRESAGKRKGSASAGSGNPWIGATLGEASAGAARTQTFLGAKSRRLTARMPKKKAHCVIARNQLVIAHALLSDPEAEYAELGTGYYQERANIRRQARSHARALERLGYKVTIEPLAPAPEPGAIPVTTAG
jgi:transposase